jgi:enoyl-CoA hydratase/carnithine racemase
VIRVDQDGTVVRIALDRPDKRNALTPEMLDALTAAVRAQEADESVRCILLCAEGPTFCSGFDLKAAAGDEQILRTQLESLSAAVRTLRRCRTPVVCAAHGAAIAGGCALLGGADLVVSDRGAKLGYPVVTIGLSPAVSAPTLDMTMGGAHTRARTLDPALITGQRAHEIGLVTHLVDTKQDVLPCAQGLAEMLEQKPPHAVARTKSWLNELDDSNDDGLFARALDVSLGTVGTDENRSRLASLWGDIG